MDNGFRVGDLVQFVATPKASLYHNLWNGKIGVIAAIRNHTQIAHIKWSDDDLNDVWIGYEDLKLLNRE